VVYQSSAVQSLSTSVVYNRYLGFGDSDVFRVLVNNGPLNATLGMSFNLTVIRDSKGVGHAITDVMGDDVNFLLDVQPENATLKVDFINITIKNNEGFNLTVQLKSLLQDYTPCVSI